jgi:hypothetical protein
MARLSSRQQHLLHELAEALSLVLGRGESREAEYGEERVSRAGKRDFHLVCKKKARSRKASKAGAYATESKAMAKANDLLGKKRGGFGQCEIRFKQGRKSETVATIGNF